MRRLLLLMAIVLGASALRRYLVRRGAQQAQDQAAQADWENEGGAPAPAER
ncbi:MAG TPA: hypothetical protein VIX87_01910 [Steroidobacteraceae bacterium]